MILVFLAMGFEEIEALATVDILRRAELDVITVGVGGRMIRGAHGIMVTADMEDTEVSTMGLEAVVLPGGMPGTLNLEHSPVVQKCLDIAVKSDLWIGAICAAPSILGHKGFLNGKKAVCFPGYEQELIGAEIKNEPVVVDGRIITSCGAGAAMEFALQIVSEFTTPQRAELLRKSMQCQ